MTRFAFPLIAAALMLGFAGAPLAEQTEPPPGTEQKTEQKAEKSKDEPTAERAKQRAKERAERREEKRRQREELRKAFRSKLAECREQAKQQDLRGGQRRKFLRSCVCGEEALKSHPACTRGG